MGRNITQLNHFFLIYDREKLAATVPGDILTDLDNAKKITFSAKDDDLAALNWVHRRDWEYECLFDLPEELADYPAVKLVFHGIDTLSEIRLNGVLLGQTDNMFFRYEFPVRHLLKAKENRLQIFLKSPWNYLSAHPNTEQYVCIFNHDRVKLRKAQCHFGWDWAPESPGYGIWQPVELIGEDEFNIDDIRIRTRTDGRLTFFVRLGYSVRNKEYAHIREDKIRLTIFQGNEKQAFEFPVEGGKNLYNVTVENPKLWWPNGYGEQFLYRYKAELVRENVVLSAYAGSFGIREIELLEDPIGDRLGFCFRVNGRVVYCKGSNWVPADFRTGSIETSRYKKLLLAAKEANCNILRVWGGGIYEKDEFYRLCDEFGIMIWQDFMFACSDIPDDQPGFIANITKEAEQQLIRLRNHPCLAIWTGGNERASAFSTQKNKTGLLTSQYLLRGLVNDLTDSPYVPCSPYSYTDIDNDLTSGDSHQCGYGSLFEYGDARSFRIHIAQNGVASFSSECALMGPTTMRSTRRFISEKNLWPINDNYRFHFVGNPCSSKMTSFADCIGVAGEMLFGPIESAENYIKKGMIVHAEFMRSEYDFLRMSGNTNKGFMNWMWNDIWPTGTCSVIDWYFEKKPAYYALKRIFQPFYTSFAPDKNNILYAFCCNDTAASVSGTLTISQKTLNGETLFSEKTEIEVAGDSTLRIRVHFDSAEKNTYLSSEWKHGDKTERSVYFFDLWKDKKFETNLTTRLLDAEDGYRLELTAHSFARTVNIILPENRGCKPDDNYFDLQRGERRVIHLRGGNGLSPDEIKILTYADEWTE